MFERLRAGASKREELVEHLAEATEQRRFLTLEQLTKEIVTSSHWTSFLRQSGRAVSPHTRKIALAGTVLLVAAYFAISGGAEKPPAPASPVNPSSTPTRQADSSPTPTRTASPTPTEIKPTVTPTSTPKPEVTPIPEIRYPISGVSSGIATAEDGTEKGMVMISRLPSPEGQWCMYYFLQGNSGRGERAFPFTLNKAGDNLYKSAEKRFEKIEISFGADGSLMGTMSWNTGERFTFTLPFKGKGGRIFLDTYKYIKITLHVPGAVITDQEAIKKFMDSGITPPP